MEKSQFCYIQFWYDTDFTVFGMSHEKNNSCSTNEARVLEEHRNFMPDTAA